MQITHIHMNIVEPDKSQTQKQKELSVSRFGSSGYKSGSMRSNLENLTVKNNGDAHKYLLGHKNAVRRLKDRS